MHRICDLQCTAFQKFSTNLKSFGTKALMLFIDSFKKNSYSIIYVLNIGKLIIATKRQSNSEEPTSQDSNGNKVKNRNMKIALYINKYLLWSLGKFEFSGTFHELLGKHKFKLNKENLTF